MIYTNFSLTKHLVVKTMNKTANQTWCWTSESWHNRNTHTIFTASLLKQVRHHISGYQPSTATILAEVYLCSFWMKYSYSLSKYFLHFLIYFIPSYLLMTENNNAWITEDLMRIYSDYICIYELVLKKSMFLKINNSAYDM